jgi:hypothetical protein
MKISADVIENYQNRKRYVIYLNAKYFLKSHKKTGECVVVNINPDGACILFDSKAALAKDTTLSLEMKTTGLEMVTVTGNIVWLKNIETICIAGVKFSIPLDIFSFKKLLF